MKNSGLARLRVKLRQGIARLRAGATDGQAKIVVILLALAVVLGVGYGVITKNGGVSEQEQGSQITDNATDNITNVVVDEMAGWNVYRSDRYAFSFRYPPDFIVKTDYPRERIGAGYPFELVNVTPPYFSYENITVSVLPGEQNSLEDLGYSCKETTDVGARQTRSCLFRDAGYGNQIYEVPFMNELLLKVGIASDGHSSGGRSISEEEIMAFLRSFDFSR